MSLLARQFQRIVFCGSTAVKPVKGDHHSLLNYVNSSKKSIFVLLY